MKVILIQGAKNTGKTTLCNQIDEWVQKEFINEYFKKNRKKNGEKIEKMVVTKDISLDTDFFALYDIKQKGSINHKRIIINSLSDEVEQFYKFKEFFEEHKKEKTNVIKDAINSCFDILLEKEKEKQKQEEKRKKKEGSYKKKESEKELNENIDKLYKKKEECLKKISDIPTNDVDATKEEIKKLSVYNEIEKCLKKIYDIPTNNVDAIKEEIKELLVYNENEIEKCLKKIFDIPTNDVDTLKQKIKELLVYNKIEKCLKKIFNDVDAIKEEIIDLDCDEIMKRISQSYTLSEKPDLLITTIRPSGTDINKIIEVLNLDDLEELKLSPKTICSYKKDTKDNLLIQLEKIPLELIKEEIRNIF